MFSIFHEISHYLLKYLSFYLIQGQEWANNCKLCNCNDGSQIDVFYDLYKWLTVVRGIQEKCSMQLGQSMEYQRVHNTSARIVDIYFDANSVPWQRFLEIWKDENHSIKIKIYYRCEFGYEMCTRGTCGAGRGTEIELLDTDPKSSGHWIFEAWGWAPCYKHLIDRTGDW